MKVKVQNPQFNRPSIWMFEQPEYFEYEGDEVQIKWLKPGEIALSTGNPEFPFRVLQKSQIISINNQAMEHKVTEIKTFTVKGSKGDTYTVTLGSGKSHCTCSGFQFRKSCKHVKEADYA